MIKAACHCGAVRFEIAKTPKWVLDCNCTLCRRYGGLWSYYLGANQALLVRVPEANVTETYTWNERSIAFHRCKVCGCLTHMVALTEQPPVILGVNARMMLGLDPSRVEVRQIDNGHTGFFWSRSSQPAEPGRHPPMPVAGPDDWR